ncbi:putative WRKY transcription factor 41 [Bienertia sinuspersici]
MEVSGCINYEQDTLLSELTRGIELSKQLKAQMSMDIQSGETKGMLAERIHSCLEKALSTLNWGGSMEQSLQHVVPSTTVPASPLSVIGSPKSEDFNIGFHVQREIRDLPRKRKMLPTWTDQVQANSNNVSGDGSYYRCTYRKMQGCNATKQVQRNDEDPMKIDITYKGTHTCTLAPRSKSAPTTPEEKECNKQNNFHITQYQQQLPDMLLNFQTGLRVDVQNQENQDIGFFFPTSEPGYGNNGFTPTTLNNFHPYNSYPQPLIPSPATSESTYFSASPCNISTFGGVQYGQHSEPELTEIISAPTSGTNSP